MAWNALPLRPHVKPTEQVMGLIAPSHCWHFDAWLLRDEHNRLYLRIETRAGGRELLTSLEYMYEQGRLRMVPAIPAHAYPITMQDRTEQPTHRATELDAIHRAYVLPRAWAALGANFRSRSIRLHYVRAPSLPPIGDDLANWAA
jgi:hypothetical protein